MVSLVTVYVAYNYLNFLTNELTLLMEDVTLETRHSILSHFGHEFTAYLNQNYEKIVRLVIVV
jgi:hypothetical protein